MQRTILLSLFATSALAMPLTKAQSRDFNLVDADLQNGDKKSTSGTPSVFGLLGGAAKRSFDLIGVNAQNGDSSKTSQTPSAEDVLFGERDFDLINVDLQNGDNTKSSSTPSALGLLFGNEKRDGEHTLLDLDDYDESSVDSHKLLDLPQLLKRRVLDLVNTTLVDELKKAAQSANVGADK